MAYFFFSFYRGSEAVKATDTEGISQLKKWQVSDMLSSKNRYFNLAIPF